MSIPDAQIGPHVVHLTSVHSRYDIRIFHKQCRSLAKAGFRVSLVVADGKGDELTEDGIAIYDVGKMQGRLNRMFRSTRRVFEKAKALDAHLYQFHDPELMSTGLKLRRLGKIVIFDSHEDVPKQLLGKPYLNAFSRAVLASLVKRYEAVGARQLSAIIGATPSITQKFQKLNPRVVNVNNFPIAGELESAPETQKMASEICYVGGISVARGIMPLINALALCESRPVLNLVGEFSEPDVEAAAKELPGWSCVNFLGFQSREGVRDVLSRSVAGLVTLGPLPNHLDSLPIKMFEYMSAGLPVIASDFQLWRDIIVGSDSGMCVDPMDPVAIANAIDTFMSDKALAKRLGQNGKKAVKEKYNWSLEEPKLIDLYWTLLT